YNFTLPFHKNLRLAPAGRLDIDSTGLLVLTENGVIAKKLIDKNSPVEKEYKVKVEGEITQEKLQRLHFGLALDGQKLKPAKVTQLDVNILRLILTEGKKRQVRRMCKLVDLKVLTLQRTRIGNISLGTLKYGQWRFLEPNEHF
ncbi:MAG: pseudouridine synthase, partial [Bdellovibrionales bacterium]|nr:pseudouridine synthase [Bdellovibrionales bacterium]